MALVVVSNDEEIDENQEPELSTEEKLLSYARNGNFILLKQLLSDEDIQSHLINCKGYHTIFSVCAMCIYIT